MSPESMWYGISTVAGNLKKDLLDASSWRISNVVPLPDEPVNLERTRNNSGWSWLEPNVVSVGDRVMVLVRCQIANRTTCNIVPFAI